MEHSDVHIQITPEAVPSTPSWFGEAAVFAQVLLHLGRLETIEQRVRFARDAHAERTEERNEWEIRHIDCMQLVENILPQPRIGGCQFLLEQGVRLRIAIGAKIGPAISKRTVAGQRSL